MITQLILIRHGETEGTIAQTITGQRDIPLTDRGRSQARDAARKFARFGISRIVASDLARARETAEIISRELGLPAPAVDVRWRERNWGDMQGLPRSPSRRDGDELAPAGGESEAQVLERVRLAISCLEPRTAVVAHAGSIRAAFRVLGAPPRELQPADGICVGTPCPMSGTVPLVAETLTRGEFTGTVRHVTSAADVAAVDGNTLALLHGVEKHIAVEVLARAACAVNLTRALTAHLTHGRATQRPYAVAVRWPHGIPADGDRLTLAVEAPVRPARRGPVLPDPPPVRHESASTHGGKAAGLNLLASMGVAIPEFRALSFVEVESPHAAASACASLDAGVMWAVRSSADVEDSEDDPMSGTFESVLGVRHRDLLSAISHVAASVESAEVVRRIESGSLSSRPRMGIVVQRMVTSPLFAGAMFIPGPNEACEALIEACLGASGEALMDGTVGADISVRALANGTLIGTEALAPELRHVLTTVAREGLQIHAKTGLGDLEFAVGGDRQVWWLQARALQSVVEEVDRSGFHPASGGYYRLLAAAVSHANLTPPVHFRLVELGGGRFGYTHGIRARDAAFHAEVERDVRHLARVTAHGYRADETLRELLAQEAECSVLWDALVMHGGVQLPFSIPMRSGLMERYSSWSLDDGGGSGLLERALGELAHGVHGAPPTDELVTLLRTPRYESAAATQDEALAQVLRAGSHATDHQVLAAHESDLRDVPDLKAASLQQMRESALAKAVLIGTPEALERRGRQARAANLRAHHQIGELRLAVGRVHGERGAELFGLWADYLRMKADTNEFHAIARGRAFIRFARTGFMPSRLEVAARFRNLSTPVPASSP